MSQPGDSLPQQLLLVRHGATEWSQTGQHTGRTDLPLVAAGVDQARRVGPVLSSLLLGVQPLVFTSPLVRAMDTARLAMPMYEPTVADSLAEYDYGNYEGLTSAQINELHPGWDLFTDGCPGGESLGQVTARCDGFIAKLERVAAGRSAVVFTHGHLSRILTARLLGLPTTAGRSFQNDTASVAVISNKRSFLVLTGWNITAP